MMPIKEPKIRIQLKVSTKSCFKIENHKKFTLVQIVSDIFDVQIVHIIRRLLDCVFFVHCSSFWQILFGQAIGVKRNQVIEVNVAIPARFLDEARTDSCCSVRGQIVR